MFIEKLKVAVVFMVSLLTVGTAASLILADTTDRFAQGIRGEVVAVSATTSPPTITIRLDEHNALLNLDVQPDAKVFFAFQAAKLPELKKGTFVSLRMTDDHRTVKEIHARGAVQEGAIEEINLADGKITIVGEDDDDDDRVKTTTYQLARDAQARIDGRSGRLDDLEPSMNAKLELNKEKQIVTGVEARWTRRDDLQGEISKIDVGTYSLVVRTEVDDRDVDLPLPVLRDAKIIVNGQPGKLADLKDGCDVIIRLSPDRKAVIGLRAIVTPKKQDAD